MNEKLLIALLLAFLAGLSTTIGSLIGIFYRRPGPYYMTITLGFSAGVMVLVSFVKLLQAGIESLGFLPAHVAFFAGMGLMLLVDIFFLHEYILEKHEGDGDFCRRNERYPTGNCACACHCDP